MKRWAWAGVGALAVLLLVALGGAMALADLLASLSDFDIRIDGERLESWLRIHIGDHDHLGALLVLAAALFMLLLVLATLVPMVVCLVLTVALGVAALSLAPLLLLAWLAWLLLRRRPSPKAASMPP